MKKILLFLFLMFIMPIGVYANTIYSIDIDVYLNQDGSANITEVWDVDGTDGTEWYKVINNLGNMKLSDFTVSMDGYDLTYKNWDVDESLYQKRGYYGINYTKDGMELCFGKYDYERHTFTLKYKLTNFIFNTSDNQLIYYKFIDKLSNVDFRSFSVDISSYYDFPDTLDVWGYGYRGYAYVDNGKIFMLSNENNRMNNRYVVLLAKFPLGIFNTTNKVDGYDSFNIVYELAEDGSFDYKDIDKNRYEITNSSLFSLTYWISIFLLLLFMFFIGWFIFGGFILVFSFVIKLIQGSYKKYGYIKNKKLRLKTVPMYRDIPCNKDIYYAHILLKLNNSVYYKKSNILGAIILKWVREKKVIFKESKSGIFNRKNGIIDLTLNPSFDNVYEKQLFEYIYEASNNGHLESREFESWCRKNNDCILYVIESLEEYMIEVLKSKFMIYHRITEDECSSSEVMNDQIYKDSTELYGLIKYLKEFSNMNTKEVMDVKLWDEYLMFAYMFGMADKVSKQLKHKYVNIVNPFENCYFDFDAISYIDRISSRSIRLAKIYRNLSLISSSSANSSGFGGYSSGGGGFSSGGGGGGSFGGGGGGSR